MVPIEGYPPIIKVERVTQYMFPLFLQVIVYV